MCTGIAQTDVYADQLSTKVTKQFGRAMRVTSAAFAASPHINTPISSAEFLGDGANKSSPIMLISMDLRAIGILVHQTKADADSFIFSAAFEYNNVSLGFHAVSKNGNVIISLLHQKTSGELTILINHQSSEMKIKFVDIDKIQWPLVALKEWFCRPCLFVYAPGIPGTTMYSPQNFGNEICIPQLVEIYILNTFLPSLVQKI